MTPEEAYKIFLKTNHKIVLSTTIYDGIDKYYFVPMESDPFMERWSVDVNTGTVEFVPGYKYPNLGPYKKGVPYNEVYFNEINRKEFPKIMDYLENNNSRGSTTVYETF